MVTKDKDVQLKLRFGDDLRLRLSAAGERNSSSLNSEIVRRLEDSFSFDAANGSSVTTALIAAIVADIAEIEAITGKSWATDNVTFSAMRRAVIAQIIDRAPLHVENDDEARTALQAAIKQMKLLEGMHMVIDAIPAENEAMQAQYATTLETERKRASELEALADESLEPQRAAQRKGRKLFSDMQAKRKEAKQLRERLR